MIEQRPGGRRGPGRGPAVIMEHDLRQSKRQLEELREQERALSAQAAVCRDERRAADIRRQRLDVAERQIAVERSIGVLRRVMARHGL